MQRHSGGHAEDGQALTRPAKQDEHGQALMLTAQSAQYHQVPSRREIHAAEPKLDELYYQPPEELRALTRPSEQDAMWRRRLG